MHQQTAAYHLARVQEEDKKKKAHQAEEAKKHHDRGRPGRQPSPEVRTFNPRIVFENDNELDMVFCILQRPSAASGHAQTSTLHAAASNDWVYEIKDMIANHSIDVEAKDKVLLLPHKANRSVAHADLPSLSSP